MMIRTYKALSVLLSYPTAEITAAAGEIREAIASEGLVRGRDMKALAPLLDQLATRDLYDLQERYTLLFDRSRSLSLHLFEHVHGESRDRGQAMLDLAALYERHGYQVWSSCRSCPRTTRGPCSTNRPISSPSSRIASGSASRSTHPSSVP